MRRLSFALLVALASLTAVTEAQGSPGITTIVSVDSAGIQGNRDSDVADIGANGRYVAFDSSASNLVTGDTNVHRDVFVHDLETATTTRVSVASSGTQANGLSGSPAVTADGRFVAFVSWASNLVPDDTNGHSDIFVHDRQNGLTTKVSVDSWGNQANNWSAFSDISADGRFVAFISTASNLVPGDVGTDPDVFVHDRLTGATTRVTLGIDGAEPNQGSRNPVISSDGRFVAFVSPASNLVSEDTNGAADVFVYDRETRIMSRVSVNSAGVQGNGISDQATISGDGRFVAFISFADNLVAEDNNRFCHTELGEVYNCPDVFVHDRHKALTTRLSANSDGGQADTGGGSPAISSDGRFVAFSSSPENLSVPEIFLHDRVTGATERVIVNGSGTEANGATLGPVLSADGRFLAFVSWASNLVPDDTNGVRDVFVHDLGSSSDSDGDGVPDGVDSCPLTSSMGFDADADGCIDTLDGLIAMVESLTPEPKIEAGLLTKLNGAQTALDRNNMRVAVNNLRSFINQAKAQRGKSLTSPQADLLAAYANNLILLM